GRESERKDSAAKRATTLDRWRGDRSRGRVPPQRRREEHHRHDADRGRGQHRLKAGPGGVLGAHLPGEQALVERYVEALVLLPCGIAEVELVAHGAWIVALARELARSLLEG